MRPIHQVIDDTCPIVDLYAQTTYVPFIEYNDERARHISLTAISTYHKLVQLASKSDRFDEVLLAAKTHVSETLRNWSKSEHEHAISQLSLDSTLFSFQDTAVKDICDQKIANNDLELWILEELMRYEHEKHAQDPLDILLQKQPETYSETDETIKMISWFSVVSYSAFFIYFKA